MTELDVRGAWFEQSATIGQLAKALVQAQAKMGNAVADSANPFFKSKYADLGSVLEACRGPLAEAGIARIQLVVSHNNVPGVRTMLVHSDSGEYVAATVFCSPKAKEDGPQALGSVLTYLRRYSLAAVAGIAQEDDDAEAAQRDKKPDRKRPAPAMGPREQAAVTEVKGGQFAEQLAKARQLIGQELRWDVKQSSDWLRVFFGKPKLAELNPDQLTAAIQLLTLYGDEKQYHEAIEDFRHRGLVQDIEAMSAS